MPCLTLAASQPPPAKFHFIRGTEKFKKLTLRLLHVLDSLPIREYFSEKQILCKRNVCPREYLLGLTVLGKQDEK
ncbi:MAG: hypothetical protein N2035_10190 [Chthoniobacterales bacterium]|nr:hypothetical protein [Chthoniobacterales bacterium]